MAETQKIIADVMRYHGQRPYHFSRTGAWFCGGWLQEDGTYSKCNVEGKTWNDYCEHVANEAAAALSRATQASIRG